MSTPQPYTAFVTGATGFTGGALARELRRRGHRVRALVRSAARAKDLDGVELIEGDLTNAADVARAAEGCSRIYHVGALFRTAGHPDSYYYDVNLGGTEHVIDAARKHGVERTVHCSTIGVHGDVKEIPARETTPFNPGDVYQRSKLAGEMAAQDAFTRPVGGVPGVIFRPAGIYGPGDTRFLKLFRSIRRRRFIMFGSGETLWHPIYIDDLVEGILLCGERPGILGRAFILAGGEYVTLNSLTRIVAEAVAVPPPRLKLPIAPLIGAAVICEALCKPLGINPPLHRRRSEFFVKNRAFDITRARTELGFDPRVSVREGMRRTAEWYFQQGLL